MQIKFFSKDFADLKMSMVEIAALKNALIQACNYHPAREYIGTTNTTRQEANELQKKLDRLIEICALDCECRFSVRELIAMHTSLNVAFYHIDDIEFDSFVGIDKIYAKKMINLLGDLIYETMPPTVSARICKMTDENIMKGISLLKVEIPRPVQIRRECPLKLEQTTLLLLLFSLKSVKLSSGIKIVFLKENIVCFQSIVQNINFFNLANMASYLLICIDALKEKKSLEEYKEYIFTADNYNHEKLFELKIISGHCSSEEDGILELLFRIYMPARDKIDLPLELQEKVNFSSVYGFASSIREYLKQVGSSSCSNPT